MQYTERRDYTVQVQKTKGAEGCEWLHPYCGVAELMQLCTAMLSKVLDP